MASRAQISLLKRHVSPPPPTLQPALGSSPKNEDGKRDHENKDKEPPAQQQQQIL